MCRKHTHTHADRETGRQGETGRRADRQTSRRADRQAGKVAKGRTSGTPTFVSRRAAAAMVAAAAPYTYACVEQAVALCVCVCVCVYLCVCERVIYALMTAFALAFVCLSAN